MIAAVAVVDKNWGIGKDNKLLFNLKKDLAFFKKLTKGAVICMGKNTFLSLPNQKVLSGRANVVLSSTMQFQDCICIKKLHELINFIQVISKINDVYIIGGGMLYEALLDYCDIAFITKVEADGGADTFFPNLDRDVRWTRVEASDLYEENGLSYRFCIYEPHAKQNDLDNYEVEMER